MAARKINTPGVTESQQPETTEETKPEQPTETVADHVATESQHVESIEDPRLEEIIEGQKRIENKIDQLLKAGGIESPKRMAWKQGKHGMELKEI